MLSFLLIEMTSRVLGLDFIHPEMAADTFVAKSRQARSG